MTEVADTIRWNAHLRLDKFDAGDVATLERGREWPLSGDDLKALLRPYESIEVEPANLLTRQGKRRVMDRLAATASNQGLDVTHCRIGVGDGVTAFADTDTDLSAAAGSTHRWFKVVDSVTVGTGASSGVLTLVATYASGVANFTWAEWGIDGGTADANTVTVEGNTTPGLINRKVAALGTKTSAGVWVMTATLTAS